MKRLTLLQQHIFPNIVAGLITGIITLTYNVSYAALIFSGGLSGYFPIGIGSTLICSVLSAIVVAFGSAFPFVVIGPDPNSSVILALIASDIATKLESSNPEQQMFPTAWAAVALSAIATGLFLFLLGQLRLGRWVRFIPYPVIGGFLAGTGWLLTRGSFKVMAGLHLDWSEIPLLVRFETFLHWFLGCCFALLLLGILKRYKHFMTLPAVLLGATIVFHLGLRLTNTSLYAARTQQWLFAPFPSNQMTKIWDFSALTKVNWSVLLQQSDTLVALMTVVVITTLLNASSLEIATQTDVDLDRELKVSGIANLLAGLSGGMVGCVTFNRSLLGRKAGASSALATLTLGALCGAVFLFGSSFLVYLPKPILGGLLLYLGLSLLIEWVYDAWFKLPKADCFIVLLILVVIAVTDFIVGIGVGLLVAAILFVIKYSQINVAKHILSAVSRRSNVQRSLQQER